MDLGREWKEKRENEYERLGWARNGHRLKSYWPFEWKFLYIF
jgi:hypothetical protein